ncbi:MAG: response regulator, partial [Methanospirillum sp.]|nr:response regulator [Methanospirillum sp.]
NMDSISLGDSRSVVTYMNEIIPVVRLTEILGSEIDNLHINPDNEAPLVIIAYGAGKTACIVDEVIQVQEIVVRPLGNQLKRVKRITGAAVLGDGKIALVLDPPELIQEGIRRASLVQSYSCPTYHKRILIAEDSVTSRALLRRTLENAGYEVITAVDGVDAFTMLRDQIVDIVVSDVDMPRMNGFSLTEKIRADERLCKIPVILVTALDSPEDRAHGISSGANAYILKSSFEKNDLIRIVRRWLQ